MCEFGGDRLRADRVWERYRGIRGSGVGNIGQHGHRRVAGQEEVVEVRGTIHAVERGIVGATGGKHPEDQVDGFRGVLRPWATGDHVMGMDVEDELTLARKRLLTSGCVMWRRDAERPPSTSR